MPLAVSAYNLPLHSIGFTSNKCTISLPINQTICRACRIGATKCCTQRQHMINAIRFAVSFWNYFKDGQIVGNVFYLTKIYSENKLTLKLKDKICGFIAIFSCVDHLYFKGARNCRVYVPVTALPRAYGSCTTTCLLFDFGIHITPTILASSSCVSVSHVIILNVTYGKNSVFRKHTCDNLEKYWISY